MVEKASEVEKQPDVGRMSEATLLDEIENCIRMSQKAYGYQHLSTIGSHLHITCPNFSPTNYGCRNLRQLIERYPERFKIKWSTPAHKGRSHIWVSLAGVTPEEGHVNPNPEPKPTPAKPKPRLMTSTEFNKLCIWLGDMGMPDRCDGTLRKTRQWLRRRDFLNLNANTKLIKKLGGYCDCEVLLNVLANWTET